MRYTEETLSGWCNPASINEEQKINNSINMIKDAIAKSEELSQKTSPGIINQRNYCLKLGNMCQKKTSPGIINL